MPDRTVRRAVPGWSCHRYGLVRRATAASLSRRRGRLRVAWSARTSPAAGDRGTEGKLEKLQTRVGSIGRMRRCVAAGFALSRGPAAPSSREQSSPRLLSCGFSHDLTAPRAAQDRDRAGRKGIAVGSHAKAQPWSSGTCAPARSVLSERSGSRLIGSAHATDGAESS